MGLVHLHRHGEYSLLDGLGTGAQYAARAAEMGQEALAVSDHGTMAGVLYHIKACAGLDDQGNKLHEPVKPIVGMEAYFRWDAKTHDKETNWGFNHLLLLAKSEEGFKNLMRLSSESYTKENFYRKATVDIEMLRRHREGLICSSSCPAGPVPKSIVNGGDAEIEFATFLDIFGDDFFAEIQPHDWDGQREVNKGIVSLAQKHGVPLVATADSHYVLKEDYDTHQILIAISTNTTVKEREEALAAGEDVLFSGNNTLYLLSEEEMRDEFRRAHPYLQPGLVDEAIANTEYMAGRVDDYEVSKAPKLPKATRSPLEAERILREWCKEGLARIDKAGDPVYAERVERELGVMRRRGVLDYFIIVGGMVRTAKDMGIRVAPGRGSAAGSLVSYLCRITGIDPIGHGLSFDRFMSEYRLENPDIDVDFQHTRRDEIPELLKEKYGHDHVTNVAAFSTFQAKSAVKDVARVMGIPFEEGARVSKEIEAYTNRHEEQSLDDLADASIVIGKFRDNYPEAWQHAIKLEGQIKGISKHPAAVVITDKPISEYMPTMKDASGEGVVTQWAERADFHVITNYGFLKMDCLSTDDLTVQQDTLDLIEKRHGIRYDFEDPKQFPVVEDPDKVDPEVIEFFGKGPFLGIFQFSSKGITQLLRNIRPTTMMDLTAANALYRPGPINSGIVWEYPKLKNKEMEPKDWHPAVEPHLRKTYGLIAFQEQVMAIVSELGGFEPGESYVVFKSMTKWHVSKQRGIKGTEKLKPLVDKFIAGCASKGIGRAEAMEIWEGIAAMSHYSFNASHSAGYALEAYQDGWLKVHYPREFFASLLSWEPQKVTQAIREARNAGIKVLPPDVNVSRSGFTLPEQKQSDDDPIRFGLFSIKDVGVTAVKEIVEQREKGGPFTSIEDFQERCAKRRCNSRVVKALEESGAFDSIGGRAALTDVEKTMLEKQRLGFVLTSNSYTERSAELIRERIALNDYLETLDKKTPDVTVGGEIVRATHKTKVSQKDGSSYSFAFVDLEFDQEEYSVAYFGDAYEEFREHLREGETILVMGDWTPKKNSLTAKASCTIEQLEGVLEGQA